MKKILKNLIYNFVGLFSGLLIKFCKFEYYKNYIWPIAIVVKNNDLTFHWYKVCHGLVIFLSFLVNNNLIIWTDVNESVVKFLFIEVNFLYTF